MVGAKAATPGYSRCLLNRLNRRNLWTVSLHLSGSGSHSAADCSALAVSEP